MNPDYAKAYVKRGDINQALEYHDDALRDYGKANEIDPSNIFLINTLYRLFQYSGKAQVCKREGKTSL